MRLPSCPKLRLRADLRWIIQRLCVPFWIIYSWLFASIAFLAMPPALCAHGHCVKWFQQCAEIFHWCICTRTSTIHVYLEAPSPALLFHFSTARGRQRGHKLKLCVRAVYSTCPISSHPPPPPHLRKHNSTFEFLNKGNAKTFPPQGSPVAPRNFAFQIRITKFELPKFIRWSKKWLIFHGLIMGI